MRSILEEKFELMLNQLQSSSFEVGLFPAPEPRHEGHCVRVCFEAGPPWYRKLCRDYPSSRADQNRKGRTKIKRKYIESILKRLAEGKPTESCYAEDLREIARGMAENEPF